MSQQLKVYVDRMAQPARALLIFCKTNGIEFEEVPVDLSNGQHQSPEFAEVNPMKQVPVIVHGTFNLFESHAILRYLASAFPQVADHWYPSDLQKRAKVEAVLDWHHSNLSRGSVGYIRNFTLGPALGLPLNPQAVAESEEVLSASLARIDTYWLQEDGSFLLGNTQPSIADLSLVCEVMQLEIVDEKNHDRILSPHKNVLKWINDVKSATSPHFDEINTTLFKVKREVQNWLKQF